jgi:hypothetical protein
MAILHNQVGIGYDPITTEIVVRKRAGKKIHGQFSAISPLTNKRFTRNMVEDVFDLLDKVSKPAFSVFNNLKYNRSVENNTTRYSIEEEMTKTQKETHSRKLAELRSVGLIRMIKGPVIDLGQDRTYTMKKGTFIINPEMIRCTNHDEAVSLWGQCAEEK